MKQREYKSGDCMPVDDIKNYPCPPMNNMSLLERLPASLNLGYTKFKFEIVPRPEDSEGNEAYGNVNFTEEIIQLNESMNDSIARNTILHECLHSFYHTMGLEDDDRTKAIIITNENLVIANTKVMLMFYNLNPFLYSILFPLTHSKHYYNK